MTFFLSTYLSTLYSCKAFLVACGALSSLRISRDTESAVGSG
jgi:hypothetical protein